MINKKIINNLLVVNLLHLYEIIEKKDLLKISIVDEKQVV